jgi:hypothetical protein
MYKHSCTFGLFLLDISGIVYINYIDKRASTRRRGENGTTIAKESR